jgi:DNA replication factor GINS
LPGRGFEARLRLVKSYFDTEPVKVVFIRDYPRLPTPGGVINARGGDEVELPRWQARMLEEEGYVEVRERGVDVDYINYVHYHEARKHAANKLVDVPPSFYRSVRELVESIDRALLEKPSHMLVTDRENIERMVLQIAQRRLSKIVRLVMTGGEEEVRDKLTPEEAIVMSALEEVISSWMRYVESLFERR